MPSRSCVSVSGLMTDAAHAKRSRARGSMLWTATRSEAGGGGRGAGGVPLALLGALVVGGVTRVEANLARLHDAAHLTGVAWRAGVRGHSMPAAAGAGGR